VRTASFSVLRTASCVELYSKKVKAQFFNVKFCHVMGCAHARAKAALARIA
jgi:hypothetical protein